MQQQQVLLHTDNFYLFAGIGPIVEGYIIVAPHRCDPKLGGLRTISEASLHLLEELIFLRGIVINFYREVYDFEGGLFFEHGRAGTCGVSETPHCYHAHLCCFPVSAPIWRNINIPGKRVLQLGGLGELGATVGENPHLLIQECIIDKRFRPQAAGRESWKTYVVVLDDASNIPRQYLRKLLATRVGAPDLWDWAAAPGFRAVKSLCSKFAHWVKNESQLPIRSSSNNVPQMRFLDGVRAVNSRAYDSIAHDFYDKWRALAPSMAAATTEFIELTIQSSQQFGGKERSRVRLLDAGCGPGIHLAKFCEAGFDCLGIDRSKEMLAIAAHQLAKIKPSCRTLRIKLRNRDAFGFASFSQNSFDAVWFSALLVHLPRRFAQATIKDLFQIIRPNGLLYISAQSGGDAVSRPDGRFFVYYTEAELEAYSRGAGFRVLKHWNSQTHMGTCGDRRTKYWINYFLTRP